MTSRPQPPSGRQTSGIALDDPAHDTARLVSGRENSTLVAGNASAHEILDVVLMSLQQTPDRADLWMMRFEILRTVGRKADFAQAMADAYVNKRLRSDIDWIAVRQMWDELAPGEQPPEGVSLPRAASSKGTPQSTTARRFSDVAVQVAEPELQQLAREYQALRSRPDFFSEFARDTRLALKRPTPLLHATALEQALGGNARIFLKRGALQNQTVEMEIAVAQAHIAKALGRENVITGNDVDEFSMALALAAAHFKLKVTIVVSAADMEQKPEFIGKLREEGARVEEMKESGMKGRDSREAALRLWMQSTGYSHLALSFGTGPDPYPRMVSDFQMLLGYESDLQLRAKGGADRPRILVAAVRSEADSIGFMLPYLKRPEVQLFYAEADAPARGASGSSARLRAYQGGRREQAWLRASGRVIYMPMPDEHAVVAQAQVLELEKISVGLEDARALALATGLVRGDTEVKDVVVLLGSNAIQ